MADDEDRVLQVADEIRRYLESSPNAADTLSGILQWWLQRQRYEEAREIVKRAVDQLIREGLVATDTTPQGETLYSRNPDHGNEGGVNDENSDGA